MILALITVSASIAKGSVCNTVGAGAVSAHNMDLIRCDDNRGAVVRVRLQPVAVGMCGCPFPIRSHRERAGGRACRAACRSAQTGEYDSARGSATVGVGGDRVGGCQDRRLAGDAVEVGARGKLTRVAVRD